jgi:glycine cleavage system aminomethyltransferase T
MQDSPATTFASSADAPQTSQVSAPTALAQALGGTPASLQDLGGALSFPVFSSLSQELAALTEGAGAFDLGYRAQIAVGSADRLRWLNGMLTNNIQGLSEGIGNYSCSSSPTAASFRH